MGDTAISYATKGWNPVVGCPLPLASDGCQHCWARELHNRRHRAYRHGKHLPKMYDYPFELMQTFPARLDEPLHWRKPQTVAVCFQGDLFHEAVPEAFIHEVLDTVLCCDQHTFQVLTKRADRCRTVLTKYWDAMREKRRQAETWCDYRGIRFTDSAMPLSSSFTTDFFLTSARSTCSLMLASARPYLRISSSVSLQSNCFTTSRRSIFDGFDFVSAISPLLSMRYFSHTTINTPGAC